MSARRARLLGPLPTVDGDRLAELNSYSAGRSFPPRPAALVPCGFLSLQSGDIRLGAAISAVAQVRPIRPPRTGCQVPHGTGVTGPLETCRAKSDPPPVPPCLVLPTTNPPHASNHAAHPPPIALRDHNKTTHCGHFSGLHTCRKDTTIAHASGDATLRGLGYLLDAWDVARPGAYVPG